MKGRRKMRIALVHDHFSEEHLAEVIEEMKKRGAPKIRAVWMECYDHWAALEGCHRIRAAKELGYVPEIVELEYDDIADMDIRDNELNLDIDNDGTIGELIDDTRNNIIIEFDDDEN